MSIIFDILGLVANFFVIDKKNKRMYYFQGFVFLIVGVFLVSFSVYKLLK
jgi:hypothetical protein